MQGTEHGFLIPRITESRRPVRDGMRFQELSSASSALNQVGVTGIPPLQGSLLLQAYARKDEIERSFDTTSKVVTRKLTPSSLTAHIVQRDGGVFVLQKMPSFSLPNVDLSERSRLRVGKKMNGLVIILIGIVALGAGYLFYGRWLAKKWGIDPDAKTPAYTHEDGEDYVPSSRFTVFSHQFSSIAGAGPVTGPILASVFGWVPVLLWLIIGGLFFGAVQDFGALYASVKNEGKSMGMIIEKYIGKTGRKLFMLFCWLFTLLVIAAFTDMVAGTFVGKGVDGMTAETSYANSAAASISMLFIVVAVVFGLIQKHVGKMNEVVKAVVAIALLVAMFAVGMALPICTTKSAWIYIVMAYLFLASVMPMWLLMQPRDYMTTFMLLGMIIGAVVGVLVAHPAMQLNAFNGFTVNGSSLFPTLFVTIACGAVSGFHSLVSSGTSSKTISNEKDMPMVGYGAMVVESLLGIVSLVVVGAVAVNGTKPDGTPFAIFSSGVAGFLEKLGLPVQVATVFMTMCVSALALTSLDSVARIGRMSFQELFYGDTTDPAKMSPLQRVLTNNILPRSSPCFSAIF